VFDARQLENSPLVTDNDDPEARIAELERQVAEQKHIAELERQLAEAKAAADQYQDADDAGRGYAQSLVEGLRTGQPSPSGGPSEHGSVTIRAGHSVVYPDQRSQQGFDTLFGGQRSSFRQKPRRTWSAANVFGAGAGVVGGCSAARRH
jgi:cell division septum initiation protein DivIVA